MAIRSLAADTFGERHASVTLHKNKRIGMVWREPYLHERAAYELAGRSSACRARA